MKWSESGPVMSDCDLMDCSPWNSPGQNTGVSNLSLLQGIYPTQGLNPGFPHCRWILYQLSHKGSPRILAWVAYPFSSSSPRYRNRTGVSCIAGRFFTNWTIRKAPLRKKGSFKFLPGNVKPSPKFINKIRIFLSIVFLPSSLMLCLWAQLCPILCDSLDYSLWDFPGKNAGVGCHFLLQGFFLTQGLNLRLLCLLHCRQILYSLINQGS